MVEIPCIDIGPFASGDAAARATLAKQWGCAFEQVGFATITGHGVPAAVIARAYDALMRFFDLPQAHKLAWAMEGRVKMRGYQPFGVESVAATRGEDLPPDLVEALTFEGIHLETADALAGLRSAVTGNIYPSEPADLVEAVRAYYMAVHRLLGTLMRLSALALDLPEDFFARYYDRHRAELRCAYYPAQEVEPEPGQLRYNAHSDYGAMSLLRQDDAPGGLQACTTSGDWIDVRPVPDSYVVNIGDLMARWTNDRWRSTLHRVVNPPRNARGPTRRLSLILFTGPNKDALIEALPSCVDAAHPAKYPPVRAMDYIQSKFDESMPEKLAARGAAAAD
ncbi:MAG: isopenicillin N synthase family oxygenase [Alphaproteobacteria bacterium]|nr:isopenicillin N synthase family oxygenase [Alphaproteobacteria bacterium]